MLSGWGGDELIAFNGRGFFAEKFLQGQWGLMASELKQRAALSGGNVWKGLLISAHQKVLLPLLPDRLYFWQKDLFGRLRKRPLYQYPTLPPIFDPDFAARLQNAQLDSMKKRGRELPGVRANQLALLMNGHLTKRIEGWAQEGAAHRIEYRYPLLDQRVIEFCLSLPPEMFMKKGWKRYLFRHTTTKELLPDSVAWNKSKRESALTPSHKASRATWAKEVLLPLLKEAVAEGQHFECLNVSRIKELISQDPDDGGETVRQEGLIPALRIELMVNREFAAWIKQPSPPQPPSPKHVRGGSKE
jgi:asparagine synthetase B (glutamine-hydrolysing)